MSSIPPGKGATGLRRVVKSPLDCVLTLLSSPCTINIHGHAYLNLSHPQSGIKCLEMLYHDSFRAARHTGVGTCEDEER